MLNKLLIFPLFILAVLVSTLALQGANSAGAVSAYDQVIQNAPAVIVDESYYYTSCEPLDMTIGSSEVPSYTSLAIASEYGYEFTNNKNSWGVSIIEGGVPNSTQALVWWSDDPNPEANFSGDVSYQTLNVNTHGYNTYYIIIDQNSSCDPYITTSAFNTIGIDTVARYIPSSEYLRNKIFYLTNVTVNYPSDYEGVIPPDSYTPPEEEVIPDYSSIVSLNYTVSNKTLDWYNSTQWGDADMSRIACEYHLVKTTDDGFDTIDSFIGSCSDELRNYQLSDYGEYTLSMTVIYDVNNDDVYSDLLGDQFVGEVSLLIRVDGQTFQGGGGSDWRDNTRFEPSECLQEAFPFVNITGCSAMFGQILKILTFGTLSFGNTYNISGCVSLVTLGSWLSLPSSTVCPQFSSTVRDIVTPFVTFAIVLIAISFISRQNADKQG